MTSISPIQSSSDLIRALGGTRIVADYLGVGAPAISNYRKNGFPARVRLQLAELCAERGLAVAPHVLGVTLATQDENWRRQAPLMTADQGMDLLERAGYQPCVTSILQPADPFIELMGEEMRRRLFTFSDPRGDTLCLRPDLTIPTARAYIEAEAFTPQYLCYAGTAFRYQPRGAGKPEEFTQIGLEILNGQDRKADEQNILISLFDVLSELGVDRFTVTVNDLDLFSAILWDLELSPRQHKRLMRGYAHGSAFDTALDAVVSPPARPTRDFTLSDDDMIAGRTAAEIKARYDAKLTAAEQAPLAPARADQLRAFAQLACPVDHLQQAIVDLGLPCGASTQAALEAIDQRAAFLRERLASEDLVFAAGRGRKLAYYTGFMFEINVAALGPRQVIASGGRYDGLLRALGAPGDLPAVGAALALERVREAAQKS